MRHFLFHPLIFYPLCAIFAALVIGLSIQPQKWPRPAGPVAGQVVEGALVLERDAFNSPDDPPEQAMTVVRDFWGRPLALRIAVLPGQAAPAPTERGVLIALAPQSAQLIGARPVQVEVTYNTLPINPATALAISLQGEQPANWVSQPISPLANTARFQLPAATAANAIGLRAITEGEDQAYGVEITRIRVVPQG